MIHSAAHWKQTNQKKIKTFVYLWVMQLIMSGRIACVRIAEETRKQFWQFDMFTISFDSTHIQFSKLNFVTYNL